MKQRIQLGIPTPCHENWADMQPAEKGRRCAACEKIVVDFTAMSDTEIIRYMSQAGHKVCGRLTSDQINRPLIPLTPPQKNKLPAWPLLLTSLMLTHDESQTRRQPVPQEQLDLKTPPPIDDRLTFVGMTLPKIVLDTMVTDTIISPDVLLGDIALSPPDDFAPSDSTKPDTLICRETEPLLFKGKIMSEPLDSPVSTILDTVKKFISDTLSIITQKQNISPIPDISTTAALTLYPNPIRPGSPLHLSWQTQPGNYHLSLFSPSGALIQEKIVDITDTKQVSEWQLPLDISAGVYFLRVLRPGRNALYTRELVVQ